MNQITKAGNNSGRWPTTTNVLIHSFILGDTLPRAAENQTKIVCPFTSFRRTTANARLATLTISWTAGNAVSIVVLDFQRCADTG
jgi:hypothetical protein